MTDVALQGQQPVLHLRKLEVGYNGRALLPPFELSIYSGQLWAIIGPNGCGKTTLLRTLLGLLAPVSGKLEWSRQMSVGYVPQRSTIDYNIPARVIDVVRTGVDRGFSFCVPWHVIKRRKHVHRAMEDAQLHELSHHQLSELSEGQKQRVLVARSLASNPGMLVLDEPTLAMDVATERRVFGLVEHLCRHRELPVLLVSHQLSVVGDYATHLLMIDRARGLTVAGDIRKVAFDPELTERYGTVIGDAVQRRFREKQRETEASADGGQS